MVGGHRLTIETRGKITVLICNHCQRPFLEIENGEVVCESKHGSAKHKNTLTAEHLRMVALLMFRQTHPAKEYW